MAHAFEDPIHRARSVPAPIRRRGTPPVGGFEKCANGRSVVHTTREQTAAAWHAVFENCVNGRSVANGLETGKRPQRGAHFFLKLEIPSKRSQRGVRFRRVTPPRVLRSGTNPPAWRTVRRRLRKLCKRAQRGAHFPRANGRSVAHVFRKISKRPQRGNRFGNEQTVVAWRTFFWNSKYRANGHSAAHVFEDSRCRVD